MNPPLALLSGLLLCFLATAAQAEEQVQVVVVVRNGDPVLDSKRGDTAKFRRVEERLSRLINSADPALKIITARPDDLFRLPQDLHASFPENGRLRGLLLLGHGNQHDFWLNRNSFASGKGLSELILALARDFPLSDEFVIYSHACLNGCPVEGGFFQNFARKLGSMIESGELPDVPIKFIAHAHMSNEQGISEPYLIETLLMRTGISSFSQRIWNHLRWTMSRDVVVRSTPLALGYAGLFTITEPIIYVPFFELMALATVAYTLGNHSAAKQARMAEIGAGSDDIRTSEGNVNALIKNALRREACGPLLSENAS